MINKSEIDSKADEFGIHSSNVQRDYIFGWLLSGIYNNENICDLKNTLILKGGNCFRKAYFENTRYSGDLDFSTTNEINPDYLMNEINHVCDFIGGKTGVKFAADQNKIIQKHTVDNEEQVFEARVYFKGFYGEENYLIKVKLDLKEFDKIYLPLQTKQLIHPYSDNEICRGSIVCLKLEELLASKLKALLHRRHSPDLFDFVYSVFFQNIFEINRRELVTTFLRKTIYEPDPNVAKNLLLRLPFETFKGLWNKYIVNLCPKNISISFDHAIQQYLEFIPLLFEILSPRQSGYGINYFLADTRNLIMDAGRNKKMLSFLYDGYKRLVEPYSLAYKVRRDGVSKEYFYAWDHSTGQSGKTGLKMFTQDKINSIEMTEDDFEPKYPIEFSKTGEFAQRGYFDKPFSKRKSISITRLRNTGIAYTIECPICGKRFKRSSYNTKLNKHKDKNGFNCFGTYGYVV